MNIWKSEIWGPVEWVWFGLSQWHIFERCCTTRVGQDGVQPIPCLDLDQGVELSLFQVSINMWCNYTFILSWQVLFISLVGLWAFRDYRPSLHGTQSQVSMFQSLPVNRSPALIFGIFLELWSEVGHLKSGRYNQQNIVLSSILLSNGINFKWFKWFCKQNLNSNLKPVKPCKCKCSTRGFPLLTSFYN